MTAAVGQAARVQSLRLPARLEVDWTLAGLAFGLVSFGLLMVASASMGLSESWYGDPWVITRRHAGYLLAAIAVAVGTALVPSRFWQQNAWFLLVLSLVLLSLVLLPTVGREVNGSRRWVMVGPVSVQASEVAKCGMILFFASYLSRRHEELKHQWKGVLKPLSILLLLVVLLLAEPDFGASVVLMGAVLAMMFVAGMKLWQFLVLVLLGAAAMLGLALLSPYRVQRLVTFLDPWADQFDSGYQLTQSLIAFGQGEWFGVGLGRSVQKLFYLPDAHTDFIFAIVAEEFGLLGAALLMAAFAALVWKILVLARRAMDRGNGFASLVAFGVAVLFAAQAFINMGVASGLLPTKGLTLPFISYGGSSLMVSCFLVGIVLRLDWELSRQPVMNDG